MSLTALVGRRWFAPTACLVWGQWEVWIDGVTHLVGPRWALAVVSAVASGFLWFRHEHAVATTAAIAAVVVPGLVHWGASQTASALVPGLVAVYTAGRLAKRPAAYLAPIIAMLMIALQQATDPLVDDSASTWSWLVLAVVPFAFGSWLRQRDQLDLRRAAEEHERLRAAKAEERVRIARDVHDVLAHSIGVMVVQAEAASEMLHIDPTRAEAPMRAVHETGRAALHEVRALLRVLREADDSLESSAVSLDRVDELIDRIRAAGWEVEFERSGPLVAGAPSAAAYRIVQEALTNVVKHAGDVRIRVRLETTDDSLTLSVENDGPTAMLHRRGHGLVGMRERVMALGGALQAAPRREGGFAVHATIPLEVP